MFTSASEDPIYECRPRALLVERRWKSYNELPPNCPRCASSNTKFCYYNNYSLSQPRYFCKGCRRYWTKGGSLRNVPVGGGCRKSRRSKSAARQMELLGLNYHVPSPGSTSNDSDNSAADGVNIDLAAVFAKFLNQDSSSTDEKVVTDQAFSSGASSASPYLPPGSLESELIENVFIESQLQQCDLIDFGDNCHDHGLPQLCLDDESAEELLDHTALKFQGILGDDIIGWSDDSTSLPNLELQNIVQFQDFGPYTIDDQMQFSPSIACKNWSTFDLSGCEVYSRP